MSNPCFDILIMSVGISQKPNVSDLSFYIMDPPSSQSHDNFCNLEAKNIFYKTKSEEYIKFRSDLHSR